ncbi:unnamed protein product [Meloidogyne enterolobii]|uniref:Uncharacterized protein n=1 Tax=Meloidogyne enterolobii TaxID=390850 RepID=A0ACB1B1V5_MELEN
MDDIMTEFDRELDAASVHVGKQVIDKLTGALYLGELIRRILLKLTKDKILFVVKKLKLWRNEPGEMRKNCRKICDEMEVQNHGSIDYFIMQEVCIAASERSAGVVAAAISALLRHIGRRKIKIGLGGAIIQFHPQYQEMLENYLKSMAPINIDVCFLFFLVNFGKGVIGSFSRVANRSESPGFSTRNTFRENFFRQIYIASFPQFRDTTGILYCFTGT